MTNFIAGPGQGLPQEVLYPANLFNAPFTQRGSLLSLAPGQTWVIPATGPGGWWLEGGAYCVLQFFDPVNQIWRSFNSARRGPMRVVSDGQNFRIANLTGCPVAAVVTTGGSNYVQATTTVTPSAGNSTWQPIVGGTLSITVVSAGANYTIPPIIAIDPPPAPGVQASAVATIANGTISGVTTINMGAGYLSAPTIQVVSDPTDPNFIAGSVTPGTVGSALISANQGKIVACLCTNPGSSLSAAPTLSVGGAGTTATIATVWMSSVISISVTGGGGAVSADNLLVSVGGRTTSTSAYTPGNPDVEMTNYIPRESQALCAVNTGVVTSISQLYDGGLFTGTPNALLLSQSALSTTATLVYTTGGVNDSIRLQPT